MRIAMIGAGYVGLVTGSCLADLGHEVSLVEADAGRLAQLERGEVPIFEPGLAELVQKNRVAGRLSFTADLARAVGAAEMVFIAVGTPARADDGRPDMGQVEAAALMVVAALRGFTTIVIKSTVPVGTGDRLEALMRAAAPDADFELVSNPEFLREGAAIADFMQPDRIVGGADGMRGRAALEQLYAPLISDAHPLLLVSRRTSELTKYAANCFLAMKVTFINELSDLSEAVGADVGDLARGIGLDPRIGGRYLAPGPGYGGSCFPKDIIAMVRSAEDAGSPVRLIETTLGINRDRRGSMAGRIADAAGGVKGKRVAVLGLTFKANTDDLRESVSLDIISGLQALGATIVAHDPKGMDAARQLLGNVTFAADAYEAAAGADVLVIATEWDVYRHLDLPRIRAAMATPMVVDLRNLYVPGKVAAQGLAYHSLGRATATP